jgi:hypothetical protein
MAYQFSNIFTDLQPGKVNIRVRDMATGLVFIVKKTLGIIDCVHSFVYARYLEIFEDNGTSDAMLMNKVYKRLKSIKDFYVNGFFFDPTVSGYKNDFEKLYDTIGGFSANKIGSVIGLFSGGRKYFKLSSTNDYRIQFPMVTDSVTIFYSIRRPTGVVANLFNNKIKIYDNRFMFSFGNTSSTNYIITNSNEWVIQAIIFDTTNILTSSVTVYDEDGVEVFSVSTGLNSAQSSFGKLFSNGSDGDNSGLQIKTLCAFSGLLTVGEITDTLNLLKEIQ